MSRSSLRHLGPIAALALGLVVVTAAPAAADPAGPGDFHSEVTGLSPEVDGVTAVVRGGDSFLELSVAEGHAVVVEGYGGEPYLRFQSDGTIERNLRSEATYLNDDRLGGVTVPDTADNEAEPDWEIVGDGGTYAWHDHRIHWMSSSSPTGVERGERVPGEYDPWRVPITVDGDAIEVRGTLTYAPATSPVPWAVLALAAGAALALLGRRRSPRVGAVVLVVASVAAVVVGRADWASTPDGQGNPLLWGLPVVALLTAAAAVALATKGAGVVLTLASVATLSGWGILRIQALVKPVLPTELPFALDRASIALALGVAAGAAYLAVTSGVLALPVLADDDDSAD